MSVLFDKQALRTRVPELRPEALYACRECDYGITLGEQYVVLGEEKCHLDCFMEMLPSDIISSLGLEILREV